MLNAQDVSSVPTNPPPYFSVGQPPPAAPPRRPRRRRPRAPNPTQIHMLPDVTVQHKSDKEIVDAHMSVWRSDAYNHYDVSLVRHMRPNTAEDGSTGSQALDYMEFAFTCKTDPARHSVQHRRRSETHQGTGNLKASSEACQRRNGHQDPPTSQPTPTPFSYAMHMAIIVMMCAYHYLPFAGVLHDLVRQQVQLLRPGTKMPDATTVSRTTQLVYEEQAEKVRLYFHDIKTIHLALDSWTSPTTAAYLGLVVHWYSEGKLWHAMLEMIYLEKKHTGEYLAQKTAECLRRYGLDNKLLTICMDNASNNDTLTRYLPNLAPGFGGSRSRVRCAAHVINLVVKAFTAYFAPPTSRKRKAVKTQPKGTPKRRARTKKMTTASKNRAGEPPYLAVEDDTEAGAIDSENDKDVDEPSDSTRDLHDESVINETLQTALQFAKTELGIEIPETTLKLAREILTKAAKLAKRINEKPELKHKFDVLIGSMLSALKTGRRALARRIVTRWNGDFDCLESLWDLRLCVEALTNDASNDLQDLCLTEHQWTLVNQIVRVLKIFKEITLFFSQGGVPLVHEVVPMFVTMRRKLELVRANERGDLEPIIRVAAHSSLLILDKYMDLFEDSEVYWIALVMCPERKLKWMRDNGYEQSDIDTVQELVTRRFNEIYVDTLIVNRVEQHGQPGNDDSEDEWKLETHLAPSLANNFDSIEEYLGTEPVSPLLVAPDSGGPLKYWESLAVPGARPRLAEFAINYLTAPATSVEAERVFSCGRLTINHLQHQMSIDTFCAKMALRSWYTTPLMPGINDAAAIIGEGIVNDLD